MNYSEEDLKKCPHFNKKKVEESPFKEKITIHSEQESFVEKENVNINSDKCPYTGNSNKQPEKPKKVSNDDDLSSDEEEPKGGCPMMSFNSKKVNPGYFIPEINFSHPYISPFHAYLTPGFTMNNKNPKNQNTKNWDIIPSFIKNSLFYYGENYEKYRLLEVGYKFFASDELREKGNRYFNKGLYAKALSFYEKAASMFVWLECKPDELVNSLRNMPKIPDLSNIKTEDDLKNLKTNQETSSDKKGNVFEDKFTELVLTTFTDKNVERKEGPLDINNGDKEIHHNVMFGLYCNIAICYLKMNNIKQARLTIKEMEKFSPKTSIFLFRRAQVILSDKKSTLEEIQQMIRDLEDALELKKSEKMFEHNTNFLKMFGLEKHETIFNELLDFAKQRYTEERALVKESIKNVLKKAKHYENVERDIISRGLVPQEGNERLLFHFCKEENIEMTLLKKINSKYRQMIYFFGTSETEDDKIQTGLAIRGLVELKELGKRAKDMWNLDITNPSGKFVDIVEEVNNEFNLDLSSLKVINRINKTQREMCREIIESILIRL